MLRILLGITILLILDTLPLIAQNDSISYHTDLYFLTSNQSFQPHWLVANRYGIFDRNKQTEFVGLFGLAYQKRLGSKFKLVTEVEFNLKSDISSSYIQQIYFNLYYGSLQLKVGKEAYTMGQYSEELSSGSLFVSNNARPIPRCGIGFYEYTPLLWIGKYLTFKGAMNFGILNDDRIDFSDKIKPYYHEKFLYLQTRSLPVNFHTGINHSVIFGGEDIFGSRIKTDIIASFFGIGSEKVGGTEASNAAGGHFGVYDFGINWNIKNTDFQIYYQIPFSDAGGMQIKNNKDQQIGLLINLQNNKFIESINYEYLSTIHQGGLGILDAIFEGEIIDLLKVEDPDAFILQHFDTVTHGFTNHELKRYVELKTNYGHEFGGRDDYYNNGFYPKGQSYFDYAIGPSLILSKTDISSYLPDFNGNFDYYFINTRVRGHHIAFKGWISDNIKYRSKFTYTNNLGTYPGANKGFHGWASIEEPEYYNSYYFKDGRKQAYTFFEVNYTPFQNKGARFISSIAYDFGEMYHNFGILFGFHFDGYFKVGKSKNN